MCGSRIQGRWDHVPHSSDIGVRGSGASLAEAFEQAGIALTALITDPDRVRALEEVHVECSAPDRELLFVEWLNSLVYEMATRRMVFGRFQVRTDGQSLTGRAWGEAVDRHRHEPAVEPKGATYTGLQVFRDDTGRWVAECVVDV